jgi:hypothetical protein
MAKKMSVNNNHGLGYAAVDDEGHLFSERWLENDEAFKVDPNKVEIEQSVIKEYDGMLTKEQKYSVFGKINRKGTTSIILHARMATSGKQFANTHPFIHPDKPDTALIHNGMIHNMEELENKTSTCDSECILNEYVKDTVYDKAENIQEVTDSLKGYFACAVLSKTTDGVAIMDIFKDGNASLSAVFIKELNTVVFSTAIYDMKEVCDDMQMNIVSSFEVIQNKLLRHDAITGKVLGTYPFRNESTRARNWHQSNHGTGTGGVALGTRCNFRGFEYDVKSEDWVQKKAA